MPWVATERTPRDIGLTPRGEPEKATPDLAEPGVVDTLGAAFRSQNIVGSTLSNRMIGADLDTVDPDFDPFEAAKGTQYEQYPERLAQLYNRRAYDAFTSQVDMEIEDRRTLDAAGVWGIVAQIGAGVVDPTILIPAGSLIRSGKVGYSVARSAAAVGAGTAAGVAVQEGALQATQETRTAAESAMAIGGGAVLGSLLGAAGAKLLDNVAWNSLSSRLSKELAERGPLPIDVNDAEMKALVDGLATGPASAGAAAVTRATINDLTIAGRAAAVAARPVAQLNPLLRALTSPSARAREIMLSLMENPVYLKANEGTAGRAGMASEQAVETLVKTSQGKFIIAYEQAINDWKAMNKAGARISWADYRRRVGQAMRNNDTDPGGSEFITRSAQQFRREVFDPLKERAIAEGLLPEDVEVTTAPSYFTRVYNVPKIEAKEQEFRDIIREWARLQLAEQRKNTSKRLSRRAANLRSEIDDSEMTILRRQAEMQAREDGDEVMVEPGFERDVMRALEDIRNAKPAKQPETLVQFIRRLGGLVDEGGDLEKIGFNSRSMPGFIRTKKRSIRDGDNTKAGGLTLDEAARRAWDEGFLPGVERPLPNDLLDALADDFKGIRAVVRERDRALVEAADLESRIMADLERMGVDMNARKPFFSTSEEIKDFASRVIKAKDLSDRKRIEELQRVLADVEAQVADLTATGRAADLEQEAYIEDVVSSIYNKITGRETDAIAQDFIRIPAAARGPLKERTFNIEDAKIAAFLEDDIDEVGRRYTRSMGADVEVKAMLARRGAEKFEDLIKEIQDDYAEMRKGVTDERELKQINARERSDIKDLKAVHAMLKGAYLPEQNSGNWAKVVNAAMTFNYIRAMGGVVLSSLTDVARPLMVHGLGRYMNDGVAPLVKNLKAVRMSSREAKLAGVVGERVRNAMLATYSEVTDPYSRSSPFERMMENVARGFSRATGMPYWNDFMKTVSGVMTQNRVLDNAARWGAVGEKEQRYMRFLGIDQPMAERIAAQFAEHGDTLDGVRVANTEDWTDDVAVRAYRAAIAKDVDSIIVTKGIGDVPLFAHTPTGRALLQFKGFALASHQRALVRGLQEDKANMVAGLIAMTAIGSFIYWLKSVESNRAQDISDNPGRWIAEGLDRSGFLAIPFEVNNTMEKIGAPGLYTGLQAMFPSATQKAPASRYAVRSVVDAALGPTVGLAKDVVDMLAAATKMDLTEADVNTMRRLTPGASLPFIRSLIEYEASPALKEAVR